MKIFLSIISDLMNKENAKKKKTLARSLTHSLTHRKPENGKIFCVLYTSKTHNVIQVKIFS